MESSEVNAIGTNEPLEPKQAMSAKLNCAGPET